MPASSTMSLALQTGAALTFAGKTTFGTTLDEDFDPIVLTGTNIIVTGATGHVIDGNGQNYCMSFVKYFLPRSPQFRWSYPHLFLFFANLRASQGMAKVPMVARRSQTISSWSRKSRTP